MSAEIEQLAAEWIARRYAGLSPEREQELARWLAADARHAAAFAELEATWTALNRIPLPTLEQDGRDPDALAPARTCSRTPRRWRTSLMTLAAAATVMLGALYFTSDRWLHRGERFTDEVATTVGSFRKIALPDGSVVRVNTDSAVRIVYTATERRVQLLKGEAHFTVAKNPERPFFVEAGRVAVRAVGTAFNVRLRSADVEVLVTEGKVSVADPARGESLLAPRAPELPPLLVAGERAVVPLPTEERAHRPRAEPQSVAAPEMERALAWHDRRIDVVSAPLGDIVAEFNRYNRHPLKIVDPMLAARRFGGSFRADEPETFVRLLQLRFGLEVERAGDTTLLHEPKR